jgi:hypothetical protein
MSEGVEFFSILRSDGGRYSSHVLAAALVHKVSAPVRLSELAGDRL